MQAVLTSSVQQADYGYEMMDTGESGNSSFQTGYFAGMPVSGTGSNSTSSYFNGNSDDSSGDSFLGEGGFSTVSRDIYHTPNGPIPVAAKRAKPGYTQAEGINLLNREIKVLSQLQHPNIVRYIAGEESLTNPVLVMEQLSYDLYNTLETSDQITLEQAIQIINSLLEGVIYLHDQEGVQHNDLSTSNIMLKQNNDGSLSSTIIDFGLASVSGENSNPMSGKSSCHCPDDLPSGRKERDVYDLGVVITSVLAKQGRVNSWQYDIMGKPQHTLLSYSAEDIVSRTFPAAQREAAKVIFDNIARQALNPEPLLRPSAKAMQKELHRIISRLREI
ncbi:protein kinase family protein [Sansalvadorimonas sp. 2012CJ34-2]|uniref:Protein kinase family protein n=1 Tax=Parendozoicomonas callyspongiae TaxID=2942213 RepID=A0ABT0PCF1_9GAMM|nr:protein kinase family protein [Sansalvadorimonas sp. 2012CJ34-2]MCL6268721.1 protein kinase family protein [Sansalvadorimonas sp. 2012CJ34-2]